MNNNANNKSINNTNENNHNNENSNTNHIKSNKISNNIDNQIEELFHELKLDDDLDWEKKLTKQIRNEIRRLIYKTTVKSIIALLCIVILGLFIVNPLIKLKYPNYFILNTSKYDELTIWDKFIVRFLGKTPQFSDFEYKDDYEPTELANLLHQFYSTTDPYVEFGGITVIDKQFGSYEFYIDHLNRYSYYVTGGDTDKVIKYKRDSYTQEEPASNMPAQNFFPENYYRNSDYNSEIIKSVEELPNSARLSVTVYTKKLEPIKDLIMYMKKNYSDVNLMWLPVIDTNEYNKLLSHIQSTEKINSNLENDEFFILPLGVNASNQFIYQKDFSSLADKIDKMSDSDLKKYFMDNLNIIEKNTKILDPFSQTPTNSIHYDKNEKSFSTGYSFSLIKTIENDMQGKYESDYYSYKDYKENISKGNKLKTNMFTATLSKKELLNLLKDEKILSFDVHYVNTNTLGWKSNN